MILEAIRYHRKKFYREYGEIVLCYDNKDYWRKEYFPGYKASRKKQKDKSAYDWKAVYEAINTIKQELKDNFPYKQIEADNTEADDVIATIIKEEAGMYAPRKVLILSVDKDFIQLHKHPFVTQYGPVQRKFIKNDNPSLYLREHIIKGDSSDGIPNILSPDNSFTDSIRQSPVTKKKLLGWLYDDVKDYGTEEMQRNYQRNDLLINLERIPENITNRIIDEYNKPVTNKRSDLLNYFISKKLNLLIPDIGDF
jgi:5'-3' exonuclease